MIEKNLCQALTRVASSWLDPAYSLRQQTLATAAEFCLSIASFELALDWIFSHWTDTRINTIIAKNPYKNRLFAVQVIAGNTPAVIAQGLLQAAILNTRQCIKIPMQQSSFARLLHQSFLENAVPGAALIELIVEREKLYAHLPAADFVIAYGQDETMTTLQQYITPDAVFIKHGHAQSVAVICQEAATVDSLQKLALDFLSYDQRGCLSPTMVLIEQGGELSPFECAKLFTEQILPSIAKQLPRGGLFPGEAEEILHQRNLCGFRGKVYCGEDWTVSYAEEQPWPLTALPRFLFVRPFESIQMLISFLTPQQSCLQSIGWAGPPLKKNLLQKTFLIRFSNLGDMQNQLLIF